MPHGLYDPARHDPLLGTMTDQALADMIGVSKAAVTKRRAKLGIPSFASQSGPVERSFDALLGTMPDRDVAQLAGLAPVTIRARRAALGIPAFKRPPRPSRPKLSPGFIALPWQDFDHLLGMMYDHALAAVMGVAQRTILHRRQALGVPSHRAMVPALQALDHLSGRVPDHELAAAHGLPVEAIRRRRLVLGLGVDRRRRGTYDPALHDVFLGLMPDAVLAAKIGTTARAIGDRRRALAVPAFVGPRTRVRPEAVSRAGPEAAARAAGPGEDSGEANP
ncbi:TPA: hypothetical protein ACUUA8_005230 [Pseudomonas aeruginosa]